MDNKNELFRTYRSEDSYSQKKIQVVLTFMESCVYFDGCVS